MDNLLYKGFVALDDLKNRDVKTQRLKDDYLMKKQQEGELKSTGRRENSTINYKLSVPQRQEVSATKILNDPASLTHYLISNNDHFLDSDNFQKQYMKEVPKLLWQTEKMEDLGDYVLLFPNPDKKGTEKLDRTVPNGMSLQDAIHHFENILVNNYSYPFKHKFMTSLKAAFQEAFFTIDEYQPPTEYERKKILEENKRQEAIEKKRKEEEEKNRAEVAQETLEPTSGVVQDIRKPSQTNLKRTSGGKYSNPALDPGQRSDRVKSSSRDKKGGKGAKKKVILNQNPESENQLDSSARKNASDHRNKVRENTKVDINVNTEAAENKNEKKEDEEAAFEVEKLKQRKVWGGGLYVNPLKKTDISYGSLFRWGSNIRNLRTNDVHTLMRKAVCAVLSNQGFIMREIFVNNGSQIALILTLPESNMKKIAEQMGLSKCVEFGVADLMSLEPVDEKYRPLRTNGYLQDEQLWERTYAQGRLHASDPNNPIEDSKEDVMRLRTDICALLEFECNMKKIVRMCQGTWTEEPMDYNTDINDHVLIDLSLWRQYRKYLRNLAMHLHFITKLMGSIDIVQDNFYGDTKIIIAGNQNRRSVDRQEIARLINRLVVKAMSETIDEIPTLSNIWKWLGISPTAYAYRYETSNNHMRPRNRKFYDIVWMDYFFHHPKSQQDVQRLSEKLAKRFQQKLKDPMTIIDDDHQEHEEDDYVVYAFQFNKVERLKIVNYLINKVIDMSALSKFFERTEKVLENKFKEYITLGFLAQAEAIYFPLHNRSCTANKDYHMMFSKLRKLKRPYDTVPIDCKQVVAQMEEGDVDQMEKSAEIMSVIRDAELSYRSKGHSERLSRSPIVAEINAQRPLSDRSFLSENKSKSDVKSINMISKDHIQTRSSKARKFLNPAQLKRVLKTYKVTKGFKDPYLNTIYKTLIIKKRGEATDKLQIPKTSLEDDVYYMNRTKDLYELDDDQFIDACNTALTTVAPMRETLLKTFKKLSVYHVKNQVESSINFPLNRYFENTLFKNLERYPEATMRNYFGEKVALYFSFLNYFRDKLLVITIFGICIAALSLVYTINIAGIADVENLQKAQEYITVGFVIYVILWSKNFEINWESYELDFSVRYGQDTMEERLTEKQGFNGSFKRNVINDKINSQEVDTKKYMWKSFFTWLFLVLFCVLTGVVSKILLDAKRQAYRDGLISSLKVSDNDEVLNSKLINVNELFFNVLEFARIITFQYFFQRLILKMIVWQNLKYRESAEQKAIFNLGLYQLFNNGIVIVIVGIEVLFSKEVEIIVNGEATTKVETSCIRSSCTKELSIFFLTYCILQIAWEIFFKIIAFNLISFIYLKIKASCCKPPEPESSAEQPTELAEVVDSLPDAPVPDLQNQGQSHRFKESSKRIITEQDMLLPEVPDDPERIDHNRFITSNEPGEHGPSLRINANLTRGIENLMRDPASGLKYKQHEQVSRAMVTYYSDPTSVYEPLDKEINYQISQMKDNKEHGDFDSCVEDYLTLFNCYSYTTLFGVVFPLSFLSSWIIGFIESRLDRYDYLYLMKRPIPRSVKSIGLWLTMFKSVSLMSVMTNTFYISFILFEKRAILVKFTTFLFLSIGMTIITYVYYELANGRSNTSNQIMKRSQFIKKFLFTKRTVNADENKKQEVERSTRIFGNTIAKKNSVDLAKFNLDLGLQIEEQERLNHDLNLMKQIAEGRHVSLAAGIYKRNKSASVSNLDASRSPQRSAVVKELFNVEKSPTLSDVAFNQRRRIQIKSLSPLKNFDDEGVEDDQVLEEEKDKYGGDLIKSVAVSEKVEQENEQFHSAYFGPAT